MNRRRIEIENGTAWRTADLRRFIREGCKIVFDPGDKPVVWCRVVYARRGRVTGCAYLGGTRMTFRIGKPKAGTPHDPREIGALVVHELGHLRGLTHGQMRGGARWTWKGVAGGEAAWYAAQEWAKDLPLRMEEPEKRERVTGAALVDRRAAATAAAIKRWETKAKRAATALKKLRARARYYDRRAAALRAPDTEGDHVEA